jgi:hypothetical protein
MYMKAIIKRVGLPTGNLHCAIFVLFCLSPNLSHYEPKAADSSQLKMEVQYRNAMSMSQAVEGLDKYRAAATISHYSIEVIIWGPFPQSRCKIKKI